MRIIFMGTPEFAVPTLDALVQNGYDIVAVVTATDKWGGRGNKTLIQSAVKTYALEKGLPILQPEKLKDPAFLEELASYKADLQVVVAFRMMPEVVWGMPPMGTINLHGSLLPKYRGAAPINWAVINGETETGLSTFLLQQKVDTGDILFQASTEIGADETVGEVHDRLMHMGPALVLKTVRALEAGNYTAIPQNNDLACPAPKLFKENTELDFNKSLAELYDFVRGLSPYPAAWFLLDGELTKIYSAQKQYPEGSWNVVPGTIDTDGKKYFRIACADGWLEILDLQPAKRKRMDIKSFLNGYQHRAERVG